MVKQILSGILCLILLTACNKKGTSTVTTSFSVVTTNFMCYDLARAVCGIGTAEKNKLFSGMQNTTADLQMILKPGTDLHSFEPSPKDIITIENADIFIYTGGESDEWVNKLLSTLKNPPSHIFKLMENINNHDIHENCTAEDHNHDIHRHEVDEHVWTSPTNALELIDKLVIALSDCNPANAAFYQANATIYKNEIVKAKTAIENILNTKQTKLIVMGDRFPLKYFAQEFNLEYQAAFGGCSSAVEVSPATIVQLVKTIKDKELPAVFTIEMSNRRIAQTIADSAGVKILELNAAHNLTQAQFNNEMTYIDTLYANAKALDEGLK